MEADKIIAEDLRVKDGTKNVSVARMVNGVLTLNDDAEAMTVDGAVSFTGAVATTGLQTGRRADIDVQSANVASITAAESGKIFISTKGSGTHTFALPAASTEGLTYTFICADAATEILLNVQTGDNIKLKASEAGAAVTTATSTGCKNTAATNVVMDRITVVADGVTTWYAVMQSGIWASQ